jgi:putative ATPase
MVIFASEDIGNADPGALTLATSALAAFELVGLPEGALAMTQAASYLASAPKSNRVFMAYGAARRDVGEFGPLPVPEKLRPASTSLDKARGHGHGYRYPHDFGGFVPDETYLPHALAGRRYYEPTDSGHEREIKARLEALRAKKSKGP